MLPADRRAPMPTGISSRFETYPAHRPVHATFEDTARREPGPAAVESGAGSAGCGELDRRAGLLTRRPASAGPGPERIAGVLVGRFGDLMATWKTGAADAGRRPSGPRSSPATHTWAPWTTWPGEPSSFDRNRQDLTAAARAGASGPGSGPATVHHRPLQTSRSKECQRCDGTTST